MRLASLADLLDTVDRNACPHEDVIDTTSPGQARPTGLCDTCGADMVAEDDGEWIRP